MRLSVKFWKSRKKANKAAYLVNYRGQQNFFYTEGEAERFIAQLEVEGTGDFSKAWDWNVSKLSQEFFAHIDDKLRNGLVSKSWHDDKTRHTKLFLKLTLNDAPILKAKVREISDGMMALQLIKQIAEGRSKKTVENIIGSLIALFDFSKLSGCRQSNPARGQKLTGVMKSADAYEVERIQPNVVSKILDNLDDEWRLIAFFALATGLRQGEQRAITWGDIDFNADEVRVNRAYKHCGALGCPKTTKGKRKLDLEPGLKGELQELYMRSGRPADTELVFPSQGRNIEKRKFQRRLKAACDAANVHPIRWHDLRHFFASNLLQEYPGDVWRVSNMMGHRDVNTTTRIYGHWIEEEKDKAEALARMSSKFSRFAKG